MPKHSKSGVGTSHPKDLIDLHRKFRLHPSDNREIVTQYFESLNTPIALSCYLLYKYGEYDQLVEMEIDPSSYLDGSLFRLDFAAISFLRKNASLKTSFDKKERAISAFHIAEENCKITNNRFRHFSSSACDILHAEDWYVINSQIRKIEKILSNFCIDTVLDECNWGPGVTLSVKGEDTSGARKFDCDRDITADAYALYGSVLEKAYPQWDTSKPHFVLGNKIITVPKNAKIDRTIAIEPGLNSWIQHGIGRLIRKRLRSSGYDLNSDFRNQQSALKGSVDDSTATIDFRAASDTISKGLVEFLLPKTWFTCLDAARSKLFTLDGKNYRSEKFSTMGNGFTFELESLIFVTLALAICDSQNISDSCVSIFGDDLIIPPSCVTQLDRICKFYGFTINTSKSFSSGPFRESCGAYFFNGLNVKPIFLKKDLLYVKELYRMANAVRNLSHMHNFYYGCDIRFRRIWLLIVKFVPHSLRVFGPVSSGDATIHDNYHVSLCAPNPNHWDGYFYPGFPTKAIDIEKDSLGLLLSRLKTTSSDSLRNFISLRGKVKIIFKKRLFTRQWYNLGIWV